MARKKSDTVDLKTRMKEPLRRRIEKSAKQAGVSMNAEIVYRLEESYGREDAKASEYGGAELAALFRMLGGAANLVEERTEQSLTKDWDTLAAVRKAWDNLISRWIPAPPAPSEIKEAMNAPQPGESPTMPAMPEPNYPDGLLGEPKIDPEIWAAYEAEMEKYKQEFEAWRAAITHYGRNTNMVMERFDAIDRLGKEASEELLPPRDN